MSFFGSTNKLPIRRQDTLFYAVTVVLFAALVYWVAQAGALLEPASVSATPGAASQPWADFVTMLQHGLQAPLALLLA